MIPFLKKTMNCFVVKHLNVILIMNKINKPMSVVSRFISQLGDIRIRIRIRILY